MLTKILQMLCGSAWRDESGNKKRNTSFHTISSSTRNNVLCYLSGRYFAKFVITGISNFSKARIQLGTLALKHRCFKVLLDCGFGF
jgi:hypothetical protein